MQIGDTVELLIDNCTFRGEIWPKGMLVTVYEFRRAGDRIVTRKGQSITENFKYTLLYPEDYAVVEYRNDYAQVPLRFLKLSTVAPFEGIYIRGNQAPGRMT